MRLFFVVGIISRFPSVVSLHHVHGHVKIIYKTIPIYIISPNYFKYVKISALALIKMAMHARSGGNIEVMGMMQGKIAKETMIVMDAFAVPVEGTETRVNAVNEGYKASAHVFYKSF